MIAVYDPSKLGRVARSFPLFRRGCTHLNYRKTPRMTTEDGDGQPESQLVFRVSKRSSY